MKLDAAARKKIPTSEFAIPEKRKYPIFDKSHAANAESRASGKPVQARVDRAVHRRFPNMGKSGKATSLASLAE
jgi:hypothetical protein